jgi:hypothetical protein
LATAGGPAGPEPPPPCDAPRPGAVAALSRPPLTMPAPLSVSSPAAHETAPTASATTPRRAKQRDLRELGNSGCPRMTLVGWNPVTRTGGPKNHPTAPPGGNRWRSRAAIRDQPKRITRGSGCRAIAAFRATATCVSNEERQARPGIDYWSVLPAPVAIAPGGVVELGEVQLAPISIPDDLDTAGHEGVGTVSCVARRHDQPGGEGEVCCGAPMQDSLLRGRRCVRRAALAISTRNAGRFDSLRAGSPRHRRPRLLRLNDRELLARTDQEPYLGSV